MSDFNDERRQRINVSFYKWKKIFRAIIGSTVPQKLFRVYLISIIVGAVLLYLPISLQHGYNRFDWQGENIGKYNFWDALFISASALSTTGLFVCEISETLTVFGQIIVILLIEIGGIGIITIFYLIWSALRPKKNKNIHQMIILQSERGNEKIAPTFKSIRVSVSVIFIVEAIFALLYSFWLCWYPHIYVQNLSSLQPTSGGGLSYDDSQMHLNTFHNYGNSIWQGLFCSISAINNAGFTIFHGSSSLASFRNDGNDFFTFLIIVESILGGIGYPLIFDVIEKIKHKKMKQPYKVSLFTKVALLGFISVSIVGLALSFGFEYGYYGIMHGDYKDIAHYQCTNKEFGNVEWFNKGWTIFINTMSTRSAGFQTVDQFYLSPGTQFTYIILMFIGGSPSSAAGGIRTTTLMVIVWITLAKIKGKKNVVMFHKTIPERTVRDSLLVLIIGIALVAFITMIVFYTINASPEHVSYMPDEKISVINAFYETASAFGTVGLSMGITQDIGVAGLVLIILLMFIGQMGISTTLLSWTKKVPKGNLVHYPTEDLRIG